MCVAKSFTVWMRICFLHILTSSLGSGSLVKRILNINHWIEKGPNWVNMATITDIGYDLLAYIFFLIVQPSTEADSFVRTITICKEFVKFGDDKSMLKCLTFKEEMVTTNYKLFQKSNGLLLKCAQAGNISAGYLLAKVMLLTTSELLAVEGPGRTAKIIYGESSNTHRELNRDTQAGSFMFQFIPAQARAIGPSPRSLNHYDLAEFFVSQCSKVSLLLEMQVHLKNYIEYFSVAHSGFNSVLRQMVEDMCAAGTYMRELNELSRLKRRLDSCMRARRLAGTAAAQKLPNETVGSASYFRHFKPYINATIKCGSTLNVMRTKCSNAGINFDDYFTRSADPRVFKRYMMFVIEHIVVCRERAAFAITEMNV